MQPNQPTSPPEPLIAVFIPPLLDLLRQAERAKGSPLTKDEVLSMRGKGVCMMMRQSHAQKMSQARGYPDLDPAHCWDQWQQARRQLPRLPCNS